MTEHDFKNFPELANSQMDEFYWESPHRQIFEDFHARVARVIDGDTISASWAERDFLFPVRFINNAAPELKETGGKESQEWLEEQLLNEEVTIMIDKKNRVEKWGRLLGKIMINGIDIGEQSIVMGFSVPWANRNDGKIIDFEKMMLKEDKRLKW